MSKRTKVAIIGALAFVGATASAGVASAVGGDDRETPLTGSALARASAAALVHTGGGKVAESEVGDEESHYEVEVILPDGTQVDVQLDEQFNVVGEETDIDSEGADDD